MGDQRPLLPGRRQTKTETRGSQRNGERPVGIRASAGDQRECGKVWVNDSGLRLLYPREKERARDPTAGRGKERFRGSQPCWARGVAEKAQKEPVATEAGAAVEEGGSWAEEPEPWPGLLARLEGATGRDLPEAAARGASWPRRSASRTAQRCPSLRASDPARAGPRAPGAGSSRRGVPVRRPHLPSFFSARPSAMDGTSLLSVPR